MWRLATKTELERENEEAERLVRESPKVKPPRPDRRREEMQSDRDQDVDSDHDLKGDHDLSRNYKTIGGSLSARIVNRWAKGKPESEGKVKVIKKDTGWIGWVSPETVKGSPAEYETVEEEEKSSEKTPTKEKKPLEEKPSKGEEGKKLSDPETKLALNELAKDDPEFASILKDFTTPESDMFQWAKSAPDTPIGQFMRGRTPPKGIKTMGDLQRVLLTKELPEAKKPKKTKEPEAKKEKETKPKVPKETKSKTPEEFKPEIAPGAPSRPYTRDELSAAQRQLIQTFPTETAVSLMLVRPPIHPDEVSTLISDYHTARALPVRLNAIDKVRESISKVYTTDPNKVAPPKTAINKGGEEVPYKDLPEVEQTKALRKHQIQTLAMSLGARSAIARSFEANAGVPKDLADDLADFTLSGHKESPTDRDRRASEKAGKLFYKALELTEDKPLSEQTIEKVLKATDKDPAAKKVAVAYFQARDYQDARRQFLDPESKDAISEQQPSREIARGLGDAMNMLRKRTERYPEGTTMQDTAITFQERVLRQLRALVPEKVPEVQERLDVEDNHYYDKALRKHKRTLSKYQKEKEKAERDFNKEQANYLVQSTFDPKLEPPPSGVDRLIVRGIFEPQEPIKPPRYDLKRKKPQQLEESAGQLWDSFKKRTARNEIIARVASRYLFNSFFTYSNPFTMDNMKRNAVYWGVAPGKVHPYPGWEQPSARDLTEQDFTRLLKVAREWLKTPVLSTNIEGIVRDTQIRAALDLALRSENYDHAIHPTLYNNLLSRLAAKPQDETLLTVTANSKTVREKMSKVELNSQIVDQFLARLDRTAAVVQEKHEAWGIKFAAAKAIVNEIDKIADDLEKAAYGEKSLTIRQAQLIGKTAEVIQKDADEGYMDAFRNPMAPIQTEANEPYMKAYGDDQSSAVHHGKSSTGRPLAP